MILNLVIKSIRKNKLISSLVVIQLTAIYITIVILVSLILDKMRFYNVQKNMLSTDGYVIGGYFLIEDGLEYTDKTQIADQLEAVDVISSITDIQANSTNSDYKFHVLVYDDYSANLFMPEMENGDWISEYDYSPGEICAVITETAEGFDVGDTVTFSGQYDDSITVRIIGKIKDGEYFLSAGQSEAQSPSSKRIFTQYFSKVRDSLVNQGWEEENIDEYLYQNGFSGDDDPRNEPYLFFIDSEWEKTGESTVMADTIIVKFDDDITDEQFAKNKDFLLHRLNVLNYSISFEDIRKSCEEEISELLYTIVPVLLCVFIMVVLNMLCINVINAKRQLYSFAVFYTCGAKKNICSLSCLLYSLILTIISASVTAFILLVAVNTIEKYTVISFGLYHLIAVASVTILFLVFSILLPLTIIGSSSPREILIKK